MSAERWWWLGVALGLLAMLNFILDQHFDAQEQSRIAEQQAGTYHAESNQ